MKIPNTLRQPAKVTFLGVAYVRMGGSKNYYLSHSKTNEGRIGAKGLHVAIWEHVNNARVPNGFVIHHVDHNSFNNNPKNLKCISAKEHWQEHRSRSKWQRADGYNYKDNLRDIRHLASAWHSSEEGRAWHRQHALKPRNRNKKCKCDQCESPFLAKRSDARFCSEACCTSWWQKNGHERILCCQFCGERFEKKGYRAPGKEVQTCGRSCRARLWRRLKMQKL